VNTEQKSVPSTVSSTAVSPSLRGRWLFLGRVAWVVVALLSVCLFIVSVPDRLEELRSVCDEAVCSNGSLSLQNARALESLGFSVEFYAAYNVALESVIAVVFLAVALLIFWRKSEDRMALFFSFMLLTFGMYATPAVDTLLTPPYTFWLPSHVVQVFGFWSFLVAFYVFPDWRLEPRWTRPLLIGWTALMLACLFFPSVPFNPSVPLAIPAGWTLMLSAWLLTGAAAQVYRYVHSSDPVERQKTKWFVFGVAVCVVSLVVYITLPIILPALRDPGASSVLYNLVGKPLTVCALSLIPLSIGVAILRHGLFDIDLIISRTLVYASLTASVVALYVVVVGGLGTLLQARDHPIISLIAVGFVAVLFAPLRDRLQRGVNRLTYGERDEPYKVLSRLGQRLEGALAPDAALATIAETIAQALKLPYVAIFAERDGEPVTAAEYGTPVGDTVVLPLVHGTEPVGRLVLAPRTPGEAFTPSDRRLLEDLARRAGVAVHAARLTADLRRSREQLVTAREEERRRLRRDLHDGLGPRLAGLTLKVGSARLLFPQDPAKADALLTELEEDMEAALADLRRLVYNLRPPTLDQLGLIGAIRDAADRYESGPAKDGLRISIHAPDELPPLPAAVEVAAYRIVQEALTNVVRHAHAGYCVVRLTIDDELELEISDDGVGLPMGHHPGVGLNSMRERAAELGGTCVVESAPSGGTRVLARLSLLRSEPEGEYAAQGESASNARSDNWSKEHP
jgi:signal transduction histidine kinase